jgi:hypothetical protein
MALEKGGKLIAETVAVKSRVSFEHQAGFVEAASRQRVEI